MPEENPRKLEVGTGRADAQPTPQIDVQHTPPKLHPQQLVAQERARSARAWYAERAFTSLTDLDATIASNWCAVGFIRPDADTRIVESALRTANGEVQGANLENQIETISGAHKGGGELRYGLCLIEAVEIDALKKVCPPEVKAELAGIELARSADLAELDRLETTLLPFLDQWIVTVKGAPAARRILGLRDALHPSLTPDVVDVPKLGVPSCFRGLVELLRQPSAAYQVVVTLTSVSRPWFLRRVWDQKTKEIAVLVSKTLDENDLSQREISLRDRESLLRAHDVWQAVRAEIKERLERDIAGLAQLPYPTFADKQRVVDDINRVLDAWGFRAINPSSGKAAYLRTRCQDEYKNGKFYFQDIANSRQLEPPNPDAKKTPVELPALRLTDPPHDRREAKDT